MHISRLRRSKEKLADISVDDARWTWSDPRSSCPCLNILEFDFQALTHFSISTLLTCLPPRTASHLRSCHVSTER
jgi:hypothetical protein